MKFVRVNFFGKEYYKKVDDDYQKGEYIELEPVASAEPDAISRAKEFFGRVGDGVKDLTSKLTDSVKDIGSRMKNGTLFEKEPTTEEKLLALLPYMDQKSKREVCERLLAGDEQLSKIDLGAFLPFFSKEDCDALFLASIRSGNMRYRMEAVAPYVTKKCYRELVDQYLRGELAWLNVDELYPYLAESDIKRIFHHIVDNKPKSATGV